MNSVEKIFNLFFYYNTPDLIISEVGCVVHEMEGTDDEKLTFLRDNAAKDLLNAIRFPVPDSFTIEIGGVVIKGIDLVKFNALASRGYESLLFEPIFKHYNASSSPLILETPVENGVIRIGATDNVVHTTNFPFTGIHNIKLD